MAPQLVSLFSFTCAGARILSGVTLPWEATFGWRKATGPVPRSTTACRGWLALEPKATLHNRGSRTEPSLSVNASHKPSQSLASVSLWLVVSAPALTPVLTFRPLLSLRQRLVVVGGQCAGLDVCLDLHGCSPVLRFCGSIGRIQRRSPLPDSFSSALSSWTSIARALDRGVSRFLCLTRSEAGLGSLYLPARRCTIGYFRARCSNRGGIKTSPIDL